MRGTRARIIYGDHGMDLETQFELAVSRERDAGAVLVGVRWAMAVIPIPGGQPWPYYSALLLFEPGGEPLAREELTTKGSESRGVDKRGAGGPSGDGGNAEAAG